jgi:hypothetical protein
MRDGNRMPIKAAIFAALEVVYRWLSKRKLKTG